MRCPDCLLIHTINTPTLETLPSLYSVSRTIDKQQLDARDFDPPGLTLIEYAKDVVARRSVKHVVGNKVDISTIVDYGCGNGRYARALRRVFPSARIVAVDIQDSPPEGLLSDKDIEYMTASEFSHVRDMTIDFIHLRHVLEHSPQPLNLILQLKKKLATNGAIYIEVPNFHARFQEIFGPKWVGFYMPRHLVHFHQASLENLLNRAGLTASFLKIDPPVTGNQLAAICGAQNTSTIFQIIGGLLYPLQRFVEMGKCRGNALGCIAIVRNLHTS